MGERRRIFEKGQGAEKRTKHKDGEEWGYRKI